MLTTGLITGLDRQTIVRKYYRVMGILPAMSASRMLWHDLCAETLEESQGSWCACRSGTLWNIVAQSSAVLELPARSPRPILPELGRIDPASTTRSSGRTPWPDGQSQPDGRALVELRVHSGSLRSIPQATPLERLSPQRALGAFPRARASEVAAEGSYDENTDGSSERASSWIATAS